MDATKVVIRRTKRGKWELALRVFDPVTGQPHFYDRDFDGINEQTIEVGRRDLVPGCQYRWDGKNVYALSTDIIAWAEFNGCEWQKLGIEEIASIQEV